MAASPGVEFFVSFYDIDQFNKRCIYFTKYTPPTRCKWPCDDDDYTEALALRAKILTCSNHAERVRLLREYVLYNCCRRGRYESARHQGSMKDDGLLMPLVQRWDDEIRSHADSQQRNTNSQQATGIDSLFSNLTITQHDYSFSHIIGSGHFQSARCLSPTPRFESSDSSSSIDAILQPPDGQGSYNLRPREMNDTISSVTEELSNLSILQATLSEFSPHIELPLPRDSVWAKLTSPLRNRDFETGALYIFDRDDSPGHVKIGWTAVSIDARLEDWSTHGYKPNLLFRVLEVPHAQRVETLSHFELIKEWRQERKCRAEGCAVSHREWFEVTREKAEQVLGDWADFMTKAQPYCADGLLNEDWRKIVDAMDNRGDAITAARMLAHLDPPFSDESTLVHEPAVLAQKIKHAIGLEHKPQFGEKQVVAASRTSQVVGELEQPSLLQESSMVKNERRFTQRPSPQKPEQRLFSKPTQDAKPEPLSSAHTLVQPNQMSSTVFRFGDTPPMKPEQKPSPRFEPLLNLSSTSRTGVRLSTEWPLSERPLCQTRSLSASGTFKSSTNPLLGTAKPFFQFDLPSRTESLFEQPHSSNTPAQKPLFRFVPPSKTEVEVPKSPMFRFGMSSLQYELSSNTDSPTVSLQPSNIRFREPLSLFLPPSKTDSIPPTSSKPQFEKPLLSSIVSSETKSHSGPLQSSDTMLATSFIPFGSPSKTNAEAPPPSNSQIGKPGFQFGPSPKGPSSTGLQLLSAPIDPSASRSGSPSISEKSSDALIISATHFGTAFYQSSAPTTAAPASQAAPSRRTKSPKQLFKFVSSSKNEEPNRELGTSSFHFGQGEMSSRSLLKTEPAVQQPRSNTMLFSVTEMPLFPFESSSKGEPPFAAIESPQHHDLLGEKSLFQLESSSKAESLVRTGILRASQSPFMEESVFQFGGSSKMESIFKEVNPSNTQNAFIQRGTFQFGALPDADNAHRSKSADLPHSKAHSSQFGGKHKGETSLEEMHYCTAYPACHAGESFTFKSTKKPAQISQSLSPLRMKHAVSSGSGHDEAPVQATNTDKGRLLPGKIPLSLVPCLETGAFANELVPEHIPLPPSPPFPRQDGFSVTT